MTAYWATFSDRKSACVEANSRAEAEKEAQKHGNLSTLERLPNPANPRIGPKSDTPAFCYDPTACTGRGYCPKARACDD
jgi:hypothetical protein